MSVSSCLLILNIYTCHYYPGSLQIPDLSSPDRGGVTVLCSWESPLFVQCPSPTTSINVQGGALSYENDGDALRLA